MYYHFNFLKHLRTIVEICLSFTPNILALLTFIKRDLEWYGRNLGFAGIRGLLILHAGWQIWKIKWEGGRTTFGIWCNVCTNGCFKGNHCVKQRLRAKVNGISMRIPSWFPLPPISGIRSDINNLDPQRISLSGGMTETIGHLNLFSCSTF